MTPEDYNQTPAMDLTPEEQDLEDKIGFVREIVENYKDYMKELKKMKKQVYSLPEATSQLRISIAMARAEMDQRIAELERTDPKEARLKRTIQAINDTVLGMAMVDLGLGEL